MKEVQAGNSAKRPADILLLAWDRGQDLCVDFTVVNPLAGDQYPLNIETAKRHLSFTEKAKRIKEGPLCATMYWGFQAMAFSPWGGMGPSANWMLIEVLKRVTADLPYAAHAARLSEVRQNLSITLAREVARQLALRCQVLDEVC